MKKSLNFITICLLLLTEGLLAEEDQSQVTLSKIPAGWSLDWEGEEGRTYFIQWSTDLLNWSYFPIIRSGEGSTISEGYSTNTERFFTKLQYTDSPDGGNASTADFDKDGLGSLKEITRKNQTDPLSEDTDGDFLLDGWEILHGLLPNNSDSDGDGTWDTLEDLDGDGVNNYSEQSNESDPNDAIDSGLPPLMVVGDAAQGVEVTNNRTYTIPAGGSSYLVVAYVNSAEYPQFTQQQSQFDDLLSWNINPSNSNSITGAVSVNTLHNQWVQSEAEDTSYYGHSPIALKVLSAINASEDEAVTVEVEIGATNVADGLLPSTVMVSLVPLEIVIPKIDANGDEVEGDLVDAEELKIAKLDKSLLANLAWGSWTKRELTIDKDVDRFYFRVPGGAQLAKGQQATVTIKTEHTEAEFNDVETEIEFSPQGDDLITKPIILVADSIDDSYSADEDVGADPVLDDRQNDNVLNDQTHLAALGSEVILTKLKFGNEEQNIEIKKPVNKHKQVSVHVILFDNGMIDMNEAASFVEQQIDNAKRAYAQVGIEIVVSTQITHPVPVGILFVNDKFYTGSDQGVSEGAKGIIDDYGTVGNLDDMHIFFMPYEMTGGPFPETILGVGLHPKYFDKPEDAGYMDNVFMAYTNKPNVLAHEIGHVLTNDEHVTTATLQQLEGKSNPTPDDYIRYETALNISIMSDIFKQDGVITDAKRWYKFQEDDILQNPHVQNPQ